MTRDEHKQIVNQMLTMVSAENQAKASDLLTQLSEDYEQTLTGLETATASEKALKENNETLREVNAKLFLKVGQTDKKLHEDKPNEQEQQDDKPDSNLTFENLFNEKGELK